MRSWTTLHELDDDMTGRRSGMGVQWGLLMCFRMGGSVGSTRCYFIRLSRACFDIRRDIDRRAAVIVWIADRVHSVAWKFLYLCLAVSLGTELDKWQNIIGYCLKLFELNFGCRIIRIETLASVLHRRYSSFISVSQTGNFTSS